MDKEIKPVAVDAIAATPTSSKIPLTFTQTGDNGTQIGHVDTVNAYTTVEMVALGMQPDGTIARMGSALSREYFNLFVVACGGRFEELVGSFLVMSQRALVYTDNDIRERLIYLTDADRAEIQTYPSLFMYENADYGSAAPDQIAYFGRVTEIRPHGKDHIKVKYHLIKDISQQRLNELLMELNLGGTNRFNELNHTHWAVKRVDLMDELNAAGISLL
jgi:hypothetical protein